MAKVALLVGVSEYEPGLKPLPAAVKDLDAMKDVLLHPDMGGFAESDILLLKNPNRQEMEESIEALFANRQKDDLVLLFFSGHGIKDDQGRLYLSTSKTRKNLQGELVRATAVPANIVQESMSKSRSKRQVVILDCCFSGAFAEGMLAKDDGSVDVKSQLGGEGRAILTSSTSTQYSFEQQGSDLSVYTRFLIEGIKTGAADQDNDGSISIDELHEYAKRKVQGTAPAMNPQIYSVKEGFKILLAKSPKDDPRLKYRKEAELRSAEGRFSNIAKKVLKLLRRDFGISDEEAEAIEAEVLKPYHEYQRKLQDYRTALQESLQEETTLSDATLKDLIDYRKQLALKMEDAEIIEREFLGEPVTIEPPSPPPLLPTPSLPPKVTHKELDECNFSKLLYIKNVRRSDGDWAYTLKNIQEIGGSVESRVFELFWLPTSKGANLASKDDLMILNQQARVTHVVEMLDDEVRKNESGYFRWVRVVWMSQKKDWYQLPHQREILGFEPPRFGGGAVCSFTSPNFGKFHAAWNNLQDFQKHIFQVLMKL